jgi:hypothetical protein
MSMPGRPTFDSSALLDLLERAWAGQLRRVSLVVEADVPEEMVSAAAEALGEACRRLGLREVVIRWPACVAVSITGVAARHDDGDVFWPQWWQASRHRSSASKWGAAFLDALRAFGLRAEPDAKQSIKTHAGRRAPAEASRIHLDPFGEGIHRDGTALPYPLDDALLIFDEDGRHLLGELPPGPVWAAHPADRELVADGPLRTIAESLLPLGWSGWRLAQISLENLTWLSMADGPRRVVHAQSRPRLVTGVQVAGVTTSDGSAVLGTPPALWLPEGSWQVTVAGAPADPADLWARLPRPLLGTFIVSVVDARGRGMRETVAVAEGLSVGYDPPVRLFAPDGLAPADALFGTDPGLTVTPQAAVFAAGQTTRRVTCIAAGRRLTCHVTPPHMRVVTGQGPWRTAPLRLARADLTALGSLRFEIPGVRTRLPVEVVGGGATVQELIPYARGDYPLRRVLDTLADHEDAALVVRKDGRAVPLAYITDDRNVPDPWLCND